MKKIVVASGIILLLSAPAHAALTLLDCVTLAQEQNPTLVSARHQPLVAESSITQARSGYLPTLDVRAGYTVQADPQAIITSAGVQTTQQDHYLSASLIAEQTLYDFGRTAHRIDAATAQQSAAKETVRGIEQDVLMQTISAYYRILQYQHQLATAEAQVASVTDHLRVVKALFEEGVVTRNDLLQAEVRLATSRQQQLEWENAIANGWLHLDRLIGKPFDFRAELSEETLIEPGAATAACADELAGRPDLKSALQQIAVSRAESELGRQQFMPQFFARAEANYIENETVREQTIYAATLGVRGNLFDGFATTASRRRALEGEAQSRDRLHEMQQAAENEYRAARNDLEVATARIASLQGTIAQAEENLRINRERYREQVGTATEVLDAQSLLTETSSNYYRAVYDRAIAEAGVLKALGKL